MRSAAAPSPHASLSRPVSRTRDPAATIDRIVGAFNTWAFKREQPSDLDLLQDTVRRAVAETAPLPFVLYWGKGPRDALAKPDEVCLDYLAAMTSRIETIYAPGADVTLLLTDTHARLNRHADGAIDDYYGAIADAARARRFATRRLSDVVAAMPVASHNGSEPVVDPDVLDQLTKSAGKWYGGGDGAAARLGAIEYYAMNMREKRAVEAAYPHAIFVTFNNSRFRVLFPDGLAIFYMYSLRKGFAVKPWFIDAAA